MSFCDFYAFIRYSLFVQPRMAPWQLCLNGNDGNCQKEIRVVQAVRVKLWLYWISLKIVNYRIVKLLLCDISKKELECFIKGYRLWSRMLGESLTQNKKFGNRQSQLRITLHIEPHPLHTPKKKTLSAVWSSQCMTTGKKYGPFHTFKIFTSMQLIEWDKKKDAIFIDHLITAILF